MVLLTMKTINWILLIFLSFQEIKSASLKKEPAFATPIYSNAYLPAAMQVIFHTVEQLKVLKAQEMVANKTTTSTSNLNLNTTIVTEASLVGEENTTTSIYANQNLMEESQTKYQGLSANNTETPEIISQIPQTQQMIQINEKEDKNPTVDSVVEEIYEIVKPTQASVIKFVDESDTDTKEDEENETRFTLLGEKVTQVPRPSLTTYLRRTKIPLNSTLQQLAGLYDLLSKDARKQGFGRFAGYSDKVLETLGSSAEGGIGPQLMILLTKVQDNNELTRDDAKMKLTEVIRDLKQSSSELNRDLRRLLPLRYSH